MGGYNCGMKIVIGQPKSAWTCPCGLGYWDAARNEFVTGDLVRRGQALNRADYEAHLRECSRCHAQAQEDGLASVSREEESQRTQSGARSRPATQTADSRIGRSIPASQHQYFLPREGISPEVIQGTIKKYLGTEASVRLSVNRVCSPRSTLSGREPC